LDVDTRNELVVANLRLVPALAADFAIVARARRIDFDDVLAAGATGLIKAVDRWKPEKGKLSHYARHYIRGEIRQQLHILRPLQTECDFRYIADHRLPPIPDLEPFFPCDSFVPSSPCPHRGPIARRSIWTCAVCSASGWDWHPELRLSFRDLRSQSRRRIIAAKIPVPTVPIETRREKRRKQFAEKAREFARGTRARA
jgi:hypothetical protein